MSDTTDNQTTNFVALAGDIVSAYVSNNSVPTSELSSLIQGVHAALTRLVSGVVIGPHAVVQG
jgi:predicted transcriptional regulator